MATTYYKSGGSVIGASADPFSLTPTMDALAAKAAADQRAAERIDRNTVEIIRRMKAERLAVKQSLMNQHLGRAILGESIPNGVIVHEVNGDPNREMRDADFRPKSDAEFDYLMKQAEEMAESKRDKTPIAKEFPARALGEPNSHQALLGARHYLDV